MDIQASFEAQITIQYEEDDVERPLKLKVPKLGSRVEFRVPREVSIKQEHSKSHFVRHTKKYILFNVTETFMNVLFVRQYIHFQMNHSFIQTKTIFFFC